MVRRSIASFRFVATQAAEQAFGAELPRLAACAFRAMVSARRGLEIAHLQFRFRKQCIALCSRITAGGELELELDLGDARLPAVIFTESDLRAADHHTTRPAATGRDRGSMPHLRR